MSPEEHRLYVQIDELKSQLSELAHENAELRVQRDIARAQLKSFLPTAALEEEAEFIRQIEAGEYVHGAEVVEKIISELEQSHGQR